MSSLSFNNIIDVNLNVQIYQNFLDKTESDTYYSLISTRWLTQKKANSRSKVLFGDQGIIYRIAFREKTVERPVVVWTKQMLELKRKVELTVNEKITVCAVQHYPHGGVGINRHRDKEMVFGTKICGISLGAERKLVLSRPGFRSHEISLPHGSLYVMNDPTNQYWMHEIPQDLTTNPRISCTFRNY